MKITYRDEGGYIVETLDFDCADLRQIDFCDGYAYFTSTQTDKSGNFVERKIPISALVSISD